jgi:tetratricopeptide (TPR) repeat protein
MRARPRTLAARLAGLAGPAMAIVLAGTSPAAAGLSAQTLAGARSALRSGAYVDAVTQYRAIVRDDPSSTEGLKGLALALSVQGRYADAEDVVRGAPSPRLVANALGEILLLRGDLDGAEAAFRQGAETGGPDRLTARVNLAELLFARGRVDEAMAAFDDFIDVYNGAGGQLGARDLVAVGRAVHALGRRDPLLVQDALKAFDEAATADPGWSEPSVRAGGLFLETYQSPEAQAEFARVLETNPTDPAALLGQARALDFDGTGGARARLDAVFEVNPDHVEARAFLARLHVSREEFATAIDEARKALRVNPSSRDALSVLAAAQYLSDDRAGYEETRRRTLALYPRYGGLDATVADLAVMVRRYSDAVRSAQAAVALDSTDWAAWGLLGMNQLRTGRIDQGRASMEKAFAGDPYNPWFKNGLDLLDTFSRFETVRTEHFELFLHGTEAELLTPWVSEIAEEAYDSLAARYGIEPPLPVRVELFPSHADFSVRTLGEPGLGALGVSFGSLLVMDSPSARNRGDYNWASVLWHELAHAFHLAMTDHRVPRWFSEGLSVHEQRKAREGWGHQVSIPFLQALREGRLKKVSELNDGFMRPDYPEQVVFSYYQASLVFQVIEERHGFGAIREMLEGYRRGEDTGSLMAAVLNTTPAAFDKSFQTYMEDRFAGPLAALAPLAEAPPREAGIATLEDFVRSHPGDLMGRLRLGARLVAEKRWDEARPHLTEALRIFPDYAGPDSPYLFLSRIHAAKGERERAVNALARLNALSESNYDALLEEATLLEDLARPREAAQALAKAALVYPYEVDLHRRLGDLATSAGEPRMAVRARQAVVALGPVDRAEALFRLALAQRDAGDPTGARRSVLRALEVAPNFEPALELLLELRGGSAVGS